ncbi:hypothetical protein MFRU_020g00680 [Monilinia fructicola]|nr:hypothetical protein MFRU_020g00680 [Monilinia fructicola]
MASDEEPAAEENEVKTSKNNASTSYIPDNFTIPRWKLQRLPVIAHEFSLNSQISILPEMLVVASELQVYEGQIHLGLVTSKQVSKQMLSSKRGGQQGRILEEIVNNRKKETGKFYEPALEAVVIEQDLVRDLEPISKDLGLAQFTKASLKRWQAIRKRKKSISQKPLCNGTRIKYVHVKENLYPRRADGSGRLKLIPIFHFPERFVNRDDITWVAHKMVLSESLSREILKHCVLLIDHNDYLLNDYSNFTTLPSEGQNLGVTAIDLVKTHLINGRWVWITKELGDCRRNIIVDRSANLHDARLMYILSTDSKLLPNRVEPLLCFTRSSGRTWDSWERKNFEMSFHIPLIRERLYRWVHSSKYAEGDGGPLAWINFGDNNVLARYLRLENHQYHTLMTAISLGKRTDDSPNLQTLSLDSGYGGSLEQTNVPSGSSPSKVELESKVDQSGNSSPIDSALQADPKPVDGSTSIRPVPQVYHQKGCLQVGVPGRVCACPGPSSMASLQFPPCTLESSERNCSQKPEVACLDRDPSSDIGQRLSIGKPQQSKGSNSQITEIVVPVPSGDISLESPSSNSEATTDNHGPQCSVKTVIEEGAFSNARHIDVRLFGWGHVFRRKNSQV